MSTTPPAGYGYWAASFTCAGAPHVSVTTCGFNNSTALTAAQVNNALRTAMAGGSSPFLAANISSAFTLINTYVLINTGAGLFVSNDPTPIVGTNVLAPPPLNTALVIRKNTIFAGRQFRGRMFVPPFGVSEGDITAGGIIGGTSLSVNATRFNAFFSTLTSNNIPPVLLHAPPLTGPTPIPTAVSSFSVTSLIGTTKRRIRS